MTVGTYSATTDASRFFLYEIVQAAKSSPFRELVKTSVTHYEFARNDKGQDVLTFIMDTTTNADQMRKLVGPLFERIRDLLRTSDIEILEIKVTSDQML
jgi:hypothetical protein